MRSVLRKPSSDALTSVYLYLQGAAQLHFEMTRVHLFVLSIALFIVTGCATQQSSVPMDYRWANVEGGQLNEARAGEQFYFNIFVDGGMIAEGAPVKIQVSGNVQSGSLHFELRRPDQTPVWNSGTIGPGDFSISTEYTLPADQIGTYTLGLVYGANTSATYNLGWHALKLGPAMLLPGIGMVLVALAFLLYAAGQHWLGWRYLGLGALFWVFTVLLKFAFAIPVNPLVFRALGVSKDTLVSPGNLLAYLYVGALTGVFEVGLLWLILRKSRWGRATWREALSFGIGFGAIEALLLGLVALVPAVAGLLMPQSLPVSALGGLAHNATFVRGLAPVVERLFVVFAHIFACVLIFYAIAAGEAKWAWLAILYKTLLDAPAAFALFWGVEGVEKLWTIEAVIVVFGLIGLWGTMVIVHRYRDPSRTPSVEVNATSFIGGQ
jgi:uncharacterized membrane protein YhfC